MVEPMGTSHEHIGGTPRVVRHDHEGGDTPHDHRDDALRQEVRRVELHRQAEQECQDAPELVEDRYRELLALAGLEEAT